MAEAKEIDSRSSGYLVFVLLVSILGLLILAASVVTRSDPALLKLFHYADTAICFLFFGDFALTFTRASDRRKYFFTWGWLDLLSSVPTVSFLRGARVVRVVRILRVLRGVRSVRVLTSFVLEKRAQSALTAVILVSIIMILFSSIAILQFESGPGANINGPEDALWWSVVTLTTVGYGDHYPVTQEGRFVAAFLMIAGVGIIGVLSGFVASWFLAPSKGYKETEMAELRREIHQLREILEARSEDLR